MSLKKILKITRKQQQALAGFIECADTKRLNRHLRNIFLTYLLHETDGFPIDMHHTLTDLQALFTLLDEISDG